MGGIVYGATDIPVFRFGGGHDCYEKRESGGLKRGEEVQRTTILGGRGGLKAKRYGSNSWQRLLSAVSKMPVVHLITRID